VCIFLPSSVFLSATSTTPSISLCWQERREVLQTEDTSITEQVYAYAQGNPISNVDPLGLCDQDACDKLAAKMTNVRKELAKRQADLNANVLNLPPTGPMSIAGHQQQFLNKQTQLRNLLNDFNSQGCGGGSGGLPADAWTFATMPTLAPAPPMPLAAPSLSPNPTALGAALTAILLGLGAILASPQ